MSETPEPSQPGEDDDPLAEAERAPRGQRLGGAALFLAAAVVGISVLRACREEKKLPSEPKAAAVETSVANG